MIFSVVCGERHEQTNRTTITMWTGGGAGVRCFEGEKLEAVLDGDGWID